MRAPPARWVLALLVVLPASLARAALPAPPGFVAPGPPAPPGFHAVARGGAPEAPQPALSLAVRATLALEHQGRVDGAVLVSDLGLALSTAGALRRVRGPFWAALADGRRVPAQVLVLDPVRNLALVRLDAPGPYPSLPLAPGVGPRGSALTAIYQPNALAWRRASAILAQRFGMHGGAADPLRFRLRTSAPLSGAGGPVLDGAGRLVGLVERPARGQPAGQVQAISVDAIRLFLDRAGVYAPGFSLLVSSAPPGAQVFIDGNLQGETGPAPLRVDGLSMGRHALRLSAKGMADDLFSVELVRHRIQAITRHLDPGGTLDVAASAPAQVWLDGTLRGDAPLELHVPSGPHALGLRARDHLPADRQVQVTLGQTVRVKVALKPLTARLSLRTVPPGAEVTANGAPLGKTPLADAAVPIGKVELGIRLAGYHRYRFALRLAPHETRRLGPYRLERPHGWLEAELPPGAVISLDGGPRHLPAHDEKLPVGRHQLVVLAPRYYAYRETLSVADGQTVALNPPLRLYDRLPPRRAMGYGLTGLGVGLGMVAAGFATDDSTRSLVAPALGVAAVAVAVGIWAALTAPPQARAGWGQTSQLTAEVAP